MMSAKVSPISCQFVFSSHGSLPLFSPASICPFSGEGFKRPFALPPLPQHLLGKLKAPKNRGPKLRSGLVSAKGSKIRGTAIRPDRSVDVMFLFGSKGFAHEFVARSALSFSWLTHQRSGPVVQFPKPPLSRRVSPPQPWVQFPARVTPRMSHDSGEVPNRSQ